MWGSCPHPSQNDVKAFWSLHHIMRSDPCRMFSFGSTVYGTMFRIWLMCRAALFTFIPFDWFEVGAAFMLQVLAYLTYPRTLIHSSSFSSFSQPPPKQTSVSIRTSRAPAKPILTFSLRLTGGSIALQSYSTTLGPTHRPGGGHGCSRSWTKKRRKCVSSKTAG